MSEYISALVIQEMKSKEEVTGLIYSVLCYYDNNFLSFKEVFFFKLASVENLEIF